MVILTTKIYIQQPLKNSTLPWHHQTTWLILILGNYSAPPMGMSNRLTVVLQQELH